MSRGALVRALAEDDPPIEGVALAIASDAYPGLDVPGYLARLDAIAERLRPAIAEVRWPRQQAEIVNAHLFGEFRLRGNEASYHDPRNSYLNEVLDRGLGIPITLAVVMMAVGRRVGLEIDGVGFPGHFLVRIGGPRGFFADPFHRGKELSRDDLLELAEHVEARRRGRDEPHAAAGEALATYLQPVDARAIATRILANLLHAYERIGDHARALVVCDRLVDVSGQAHHLRERGRHAFELGAMRAARVDFASYLRAAPDAEDADAIRAMLAEASRREAPLH